MVPGAAAPPRCARSGRHVAVSPGALPRFLERFESVYGNLGKTDAILAAAAAHHRLLWIHPFLDGNGRVARLMSHAMLLEALDTGGVWSIARGLARNVEAYKSLLAACDLPRRNDLDGRGSLSEEALAEFTRFFLTTCIDQVAFMEGLVSPTACARASCCGRKRKPRLATCRPRPARSSKRCSIRGELPRGEVADLLGTSARHARRVVVGAARARSAHLRGPARSAAPCLPGRARLTLDAGTVSGGAVNGAFAQIKESQALTHLADRLYPFLPGTPHPYANKNLSFPGVAATLGLAKHWPGGSKLPTLPRYRRS